jgi:hypothetical protein
MSKQHGSGRLDHPAIGQPHQDAGHPPCGTGQPPWGAGRAPWDVGQPQPALAAVAGAIRGRVLDQAAYLGGVRTVLRPGGRLFVLGYSDRQPAGQPVPHGLSRPAVESCFTGGWDLESLQPATCSSNLYADGVAGWLATVTRI